MPLGRACTKEQGFLGRCHCETSLGADRGSPDPPRAGPHRRALRVSRFKRYEFNSREAAASLALAGAAVAARWISNRTAKSAEAVALDEVAHRIRTQLHLLIVVRHPSGGVRS